MPNKNSPPNVSALVRVIHPVVHVVTIPVVHVATILHQRFPLVGSKKAKKCSIGGVLVLLASYGATHPVGFVPHFLWDALCYGLHGYGLTPFLKVICLKFDLESIDEVEEDALKGNGKGKPPVEDIT